MRKSVPRTFDQGAKAKRILEKIASERGIERRWHGVLAGVDPEFLESIHDSTVDVLMKKKAVPQWVKELVLIGVDAATFWPGIVGHINAALDLGVTREQIVETLETTSLAAGTHSMAFGLERLDDILQARKSNKVKKSIY